MTLYREDFYKIQKNKRVFSLKRFLILLIILIIFTLVIFSSRDRKKIMRL